MNRRMIDDEDDENTVIVSTVFHLPDDFLLGIMEDDGYELTRDEEQNLIGLIGDLRIYFEVNPIEGTVFVLGVR